MHPPNWIDLTGKTFGYWTVLSFVAGNKNGNPKWLCKCVCGNEVAVHGGSLRGGLSKSCGCRNAEFISFKKIIHGYARGKENMSPEYRAYQGARKRCRNPAQKCYKNYGGRGIKFLFSSFEDFITDVGDRPGPGYSLDRIDNDGHYERGNVRWSTTAEQYKNRRVKYLSEFSDEELVKEVKRRNLLL